MRSTRSLAITLVVVAVLAGACGKAISDKYEIENEPFTLTDIEGSDLKEVVLTQRATERIGIETAQVTQSESTLVVPSSALWMDIEGVFWVYTNPAPLTYVRHAVTPIDDDGTFAYLTSGPDPGTTVVSIGVPELFGTEVGVGK